MSDGVDAVMTFEDWWQHNKWCDKEKGSYIWEAATKAENERCVALCQEEQDEWHGNSDAHAGVRCCISRIKGDYG